MPTILVVDDDPDTCRNMADLFGDLGYAIDTAELGDVALAKARQRRYDLGLLDLRMPGMDGLTLCRRLRQLQPLMVTMIVTAYAGNGLEEEAREAGARRVYFALTSPPLVSPCPYGIDMATKTEFIAAGREPHEVANELDADYVLYLDREAMNEAARAGNPRIEQFCNACFTGEYPTGDITSEVLDRIGNERDDSRQKLFSFSR